ncbi:MAG: hypothetical protein H6825_03505 [Planctomycetes bacterium]|nr:hypothetical protein [Planctomycetota bacterium]
MFGRKKPAPGPEADDRPVRDNLGFRLMLGPARLGARLAGWMGADRNAAEAILLTRLRLDMRTGGLKQPNKPEGAGLLFTCGLYAFFGLTGMVLAVPEIPVHLGVALVEGLLLVLLGMLLVSDYVTILIDPAEADVVAPRPVSGRTLFLARLVHLALYLGPPVLAFSIAPTVVAVLGPAGWRLAVLLPLLSCLTALLAVSAVLLLFLVLVRRLDSERLAAVLLRAQIGSNLLFFVIYMGFTTSARNPALTSWAKVTDWTHLLVPPMWMGGVYSLVAGDGERLAVPLALLAVGVPALLLLAVVRLAGDRFVSGMAGMRAPPAGGPPRPAGRIRRLAARLVRPGAERAGFDCFLELSVRERGFRSRVYPMLVIPFVMVGWAAFDPERAAHGGASPMVWGAFIPILYAVIILMQVRYSDTPGAAWLFAATPLVEHGLFVAGVVKAVIFAFLLPWIVLVMFVAALASGDVPLLDVLFGVEISLLLAVTSARFAVKEAFPFSREFTPRQSGQQALMFGVMFAAGLAMGLHWLVGKLPYGIAASCILFVPGIAWRLRALHHLDIDPRSIPIPK